MCSIYILQLHTGTIPSKIIRLFTRYKYSHISLSLDNKMTKMYSFGRRTPNNPLNAGFIIENKNNKFFKKFNNTYCRIYKLEITDEMYNKLINLLSNYEKNKNKYNYDIIGLILKIFKINYKRKNHYVCSQFIGHLLSESDIYNFNKPEEKIVPSDFEKIPNLKNIYVGKLLNY